MKSVRKIIKEMVEKYPNDMELGARVRWYIRWLYGEEKTPKPKDWSVWLNKWDKVEKRKKAITQQDIQWLYVKMVLWILAGLGYFYFVIMGFHLWARNQNTLMQVKVTRVE